MIWIKLATGRLLNLSQVLRITITMKMVCAWTEIPGSDLCEVAKGDDHELVFAGVEAIIRRGIPGLWTIDELVGEGRKALLQGK